MEPPSLSQRDYYEFMGYEGESLKRRYAMYATHFTPGGVVVDIGCGRGEFLELLAERGITCRGVDADPGMVAVCRDKGFDVVAEDAIDYLNSERGNLHGVFMAHVVEHLPAVEVPRLIGAGAAALHAGGRLMVVTPSARNLQMQLHDFWIDLQHVRFYVPETIRWLFHSAGLIEISDGLNPEYTIGPNLQEHRPVQRGELGPVAVLTSQERTRERARRRFAGPTRKRLAWLEQIVHRQSEVISLLSDRLVASDRAIGRLSAVIRGYYPPAEFFVTGVAPADVPP